MQPRGVWGCEAAAPLAEPRSRATPIMEPSWPPRCQAGLGAAETPQGSGSLSWGPVTECLLRPSLNPWTTTLGCPWTFLCLPLALDPWPQKPAQFPGWLGWEGVAV